MHTETGVEGVVVVVRTADDEDDEVDIYCSLSLSPSHSFSPLQKKTHVHKIDTLNRCELNLTDLIEESNKP